MVSRKRRPKGFACNEYARCKKTENQSIEESERHDETAIETQEFDENDCLSSKADINTSLGPQKRSFIDNELMSMLVTKKK
ncbi:BFH_HP2_G0017510.mRNA.1.CDS.1 [Saccharomyces cerevisiae]|nr:BFH_HP2_G0017510.mRNA.1.CDS.1 [Saccharomyces cerevisiae]CAI6498153.1 BFH_HP2_G0017510.mRNA.1.CDS.1 [Saccharomyces cerevisiae]